MIAALFSVAALVIVSLVLRDFSKARYLLDVGMPASAKVTQVSSNRWAGHNGRPRVSVSFTWSFAGTPRSARIGFVLGRRERPPMVGDRLSLLLDPSDAAVHLVPMVYGFVLESSEELGQRRVGS